MIPARIFSNLDELRSCQWPDFFPVMPSVGQYVESFTGKRARIVDISWVPDDYDNKRFKLVVELNR